MSQRVTTVPYTAGGHTVYTGAITNTATAVKTTAGQVYGWHFHNPNAAIVYVQFFDTASPTVGTTAPVYSIGIPANGTAAINVPAGLPHSNSIRVAVTTTRAGSTAPGSSVDLNIFYT